ncbi:MAG: ABC transporter permease [Acidobacteriaceae bacterium]
MMNRLQSLWNNLFHRDRLNHDLDEELHAWVELVSAEKVRSGLSPDEASRETRREMGGVDRVRQGVRDIRSGASLERLAQDIRYGLRALAKNPAFTLVAVATLALGIGANTAIFSVVDAVLLRPLPYTDPGRLVSMSEDQPKAAVTGAGMSWPAFTVLRGSQSPFSAIAGLATHALTLTGHGEPADESTVAVTPDFFLLFAARPLLGRTLLPQDGADGAPAAVILSENLWRTRFGADPHIAGHTIALDQRSFTVVGVMPASFRTPFVGQPDQVWIPLAQDPLFSHWRTRPPQAHWLPGIARLRPGVSIAAAQAQLRTISAALARQFPGEHGWQLRIESLQHAISGDMQQPLLLLMAAVGLVLLIACANIANLLLTRATSRSREIGIRVALGATRARIARQLLTESALLGLLGGLAGAFLAWGCVALFASALPPELLQLNPIRVNGSVLAFAFLLSMAASLAFGLAPVLLAARSDPQAVLRDGSRAGEARGAHRLRNALAVAEVALAMVLLSGAGLLLRSFAHLLSISPGFQTQHLFKAEISLPRYQYVKPEQWTAFANELMTRLRAQPGLEDSALGIPLPISDDAVTLPFTIAGSPPLPQGQANTADYVSTSPQYFRVMGISLARGRLFSADDTAMTPNVALISQALARRYFPHQNPIGRRMVFGFPPYGNVSRKIIGVVGDIRDVSLAQKPGPIMYVPFAQAPFWGAEVVVRSSLPPADLATAIRTQTHQIDPGVPVTKMETLPEALHTSMAEPRLQTLLLAIFGAMALLLAMIGIYGVISFSVSRRTREIGVRMALGASRASLSRLVLGESVRLALFGLAAGIPAALVSTHFLSSLLFAVAPTDPITFVAVAVLLAIVSLAAGFFPARRAMHIDPVVALRWE